MDICFFSWICSKSELPTSKYATSARNFDPHPMENLKKNWNAYKSLKNHNNSLKTMRLKLFVSNSDLEATCVATQLRQWPQRKCSSPGHRSETPAARSYRFWWPAARSYRFWGPLGTIWDLWDHHGTIWEMDSMKLSVSLRIRTSGVRGSIRLVERLPKVICTLKILNP